MSLCFISKASFFLKNKRFLLVPVVPFLLVVGLLFTSLSDHQHHNIHVPPSASESDRPFCPDHIVVNLGTIERRSLHCLLFCLGQKTVGLFPCLRNTGHWDSIPIIYWNNTSQLVSEFTNCGSSGVETDLCRIPLVLSALQHD